MQNYIIASRTAQGYEDWGKSSVAERLDVVSRWHVAQIELGKEKHKYPLGLHRSHSGASKWQKSRPKSKDSRSRSGEHGQQRSRAEVGTQLPNTDFESAIPNSVTVTSRGDPEEDRLIERALRASVAELHLTSNGDDENNSIERAIQASLEDTSNAKRQTSEPKASPDSDTTSGGSPGSKAKVRESVRRRSSRQQAHAQECHDSIVRDDPDVDSDDDENIKIALERSQSTSTHVFLDSEETEYQKAIEDSQSAHDQQEQANARMKTEEEIVLEYVKRQSLAENKYRQGLNS